MSRSKSKWVKIADAKVKHFWKCENPSCEEKSSAEFNPTASVAIGVLICGNCAEGMVYQYTEVLQFVK